MVRPGENAHDDIDRNRLLRPREPPPWHSFVFPIIHRALRRMYYASTLVAKSKLKDRNFSDSGIADEPPNALEVIARPRRIYGRRKSKDATRSKVCGRSAAFSTRMRFEIHCPCSDIKPLLFV